MSNNQAMDQLDRAGDKMARDFKVMITDGEDLLKAAAGVSGEGFAAARSRFTKKLESARAALADASQPIRDKTAQTARAANHYVHANPWTAVGVAIAAGALIGFLSAASRK
jgi:ElaB/YqjD/DUF883 family membrane-anchored ribosome-binding protein